MKIKNKTYLKERLNKGLSATDKIAFWIDGSWLNVGTSYGGDYPIAYLCWQRFYNMTKKQCDILIKEIEIAINTGMSIKMPVLFFKRNNFITKKRK